MRQTTKLQKLIAAHAFLSGVKPSVRKLFCECAALQRFEERQRVFCEGSPAEYFYLVNSGQIVLEVFVPGREMVTVDSVGPGEALGWSWLFPPFQWHFSATAVKPTEAIVFEAETLRETARNDHKFCYELAIRMGEVLAHRLQDVRTRLIYASQDPLSAG